MVPGVSTSGTLASQIIHRVYPSGTTISYDPSPSGIITALCSLAYFLVVLQPLPMIPRISLSGTKISLSFVGYLLELQNPNGPYDIS